MLVPLTRENGKKKFLGSSESQATLCAHVHVCALFWAP